MNPKQVLEAMVKILEDNPEVQKLNLSWHIMPDASYAAKEWDETEGRYAECFCEVVESLQ